MRRSVLKGRKLGCVPRVTAAISGREPLHMPRSMLDLGACKSTHAVLIVVATGARVSA